MGKYLLPIILFLAFLLRFISVGSFPVGFNADEASNGYDAYSILRTGRDQWGNTLPIVLKSFGDYKSPVYSYLAIPSVAVFGLSVFATRLPNVVIGTLAVFAIYLLVNEILKLKKLTDDPISKWLGMVAAFLLAVNPWSVMMSRGAFEANLITFFLPMGIYFFLKGIGNSKFFVWAATFFGLSLFTYHSAKLITPLVIFGLIIIFRRDLLKLGLKKLVLPAVILLIFVSGLIYTLGIGGGARIAERSITQGALEQGFDERIKAISEGVNPTIAKIFHNRYQVIVGRFIFNYSQYFSHKFFIQNGAGDASYGMIPGIGVLNRLETLLLLGIIPLLLIEKKYRKLVVVLLVWLAITPLTAALATGIGYSGNRAEGMLPVLQIIEVFGLVGWVLVLRKFKRIPLKPVGIVVAAIFVFEVYNFVSSYFKTPSNLALRQEVYGSLETASWLSQNTSGREVVVSRSLTEPQSFVAFANKWDPTGFQKSTMTWGFDEANLSWVDQLPKYSVGNYTFKSIDPIADFSSGRIVVVKADEFTGDIVPTKVMRFPDGTPNIYIIDTDQKIYAKNN
jgi:4-amino-4-deoxy-L-arabinose transferase-like glycosyltransferase